MAASCVEWGRTEAEMSDDQATKTMTPSEFAAAMREVAKGGDYNGGDIEAAHQEADKLLCAMLRNLGYGEGVDAFENMDRWYS